MNMIDEELQGVLGDRYQGEPGKAKFLSKSKTSRHNRAIQNRIVSIAKWVCTCGGVSMLMWWFQVNGMMDMEASYPCIVVCALLAGFGVGKNMVK